MGVQVVKAVREHSQATGPAFAVLWFLADRVFDENIEREGAALRWDSQSTIAKGIRYDVRTVSRGLQRLEELGEIRNTGMMRGPAGQKTVVWSVLPGVFGEVF